MYFSALPWVNSDQTLRGTRSKKICLIASQSIGLNLYLECYPMCVFGHARIVVRVSYVGTK